MSTDIAGYRAESDAPPSDVTLASILTNKAPLLNTPGSDVAEPLYYGKSNSSVNAAEQQYYIGKDRIDFQGTKSLTSQQNCYISNRYFAGNVWLNMQLDGLGITWSADISPAENPYFCMEQGWGFSLIDRLMYYLGASNVVNVAISGITNLALALASVETREKRMQILEMAGKWLFSRYSGSVSSGDVQDGVDSNILGSQLAAPSPSRLLFRNGTNVTGDLTQGVTIGNVADPNFLHALIPLRMPWASLNAMQGRLPFDTNLLNQPINVQIQFRQPPIRAVSSWFSTDPFATIGGNAVDMNLQYEQTELIDKSLSLRTELLQNPDFNVGLPFQFLQSMPFDAKYQQFSATNVLSTQTQKFNITSMMNADLTSIIVAIQEPVNNQQYGNYCDFVVLSDLTLELNGQQFTVYQKDNYYGMQASRQIGAVSLSHPVLLRTNTDAKAGQGSEATGALCIMKDIGVYEINMNRLRSLANESHLVNVPRFTNQTFQISFTVAPALNSFCYAYSAADQLATRTYTANITYLYNGVFQVGGSGGASKLFT